MRAIGIVCIAAAAAGCSGGFAAAGGLFVDAGDASEGGELLEAGSLEGSAADVAGELADVDQVDDGGQLLEAGPLEAAADVDAGDGAPRALCCVDYAPGAPAVACGGFQCGHPGAASVACSPAACVVGASSCWPCAPGYGGPGQPACNGNPAEPAGNVAYCP